MKIVTRYKEVKPNKKSIRFKCNSNSDLATVKLNPKNLLEMEGRNKIKIVVYNPRLKRLISSLSEKDKNKGLFQAINRMSKYNYYCETHNLFAKKKNEYIDPLKRFTISRIINDPINGVKEKGNKNFQIFKLSVNLKNKVRHYFVKEYRRSLSMWENSANELINLKLLEKNGVNIIKPQFSFDSIDHNNSSNSRGFIVYDYTDMFTLEEVIKGKASFRLTTKEIKQISNKLFIEITSILKQSGFKLNDTFEHNIFIRKEKGNIKLYFFDIYSDLFISEIYKLGKINNII